MTRGEMIKSFANVSARCKFQCPYSNTCDSGNFCIFKEVALLLNRDDVNDRYQKEKLMGLKNIAEWMTDYIRFLEAICKDYYDMIHDYNGGVVKKLRIPGKRKKVLSGRPPRMARRDRSAYDGDPRYAAPRQTDSEYYKEELV